MVKIGWSIARARTSSFDITLNEAAQKACDKKPEVRDYFGIIQKDNGKLKVNSNRRLRGARIATELVLE